MADVELVPIDAGMIKEFINNGMERKVYFVVPTLMEDIE